MMSAAAVLERGAAARPDDGGFLLDAGSMMAGWGEPNRSRGLEWIERARGVTSEQRWLLAAARTAGFLGDRARSLRHWRTLVERHPRRIEAWRGLVRCVAEESGEEEALRWLDEGTAKFPEVTGLWALQAEWLRGTKRGPLEALDRLLEISPSDAWALRERANQRLAVGRAEEAEADAKPETPAADGDEEGARDRLAKAAVYLSLHQDLGSIRALERATSAVAMHVPQARRSARRLRRLWRIAPPCKRPGFLQRDIGRTWFWYLIGIGVLARILVAIIGE
jgi:tetratricopeptide (TPR) repeat protein